MNENEDGTDSPSSSLLYNKVSNKVPVGFDETFNVNFKSHLHITEPCNFSIII